MFNFLIPYIEIILPISAVILLMLVAKPLFDKHYVARFRYYVWLIIALRLLFPFDIEFSGKPRQPVQIIVQDVVLYQTQPSTPDNQSDLSVITPAQPENNAEINVNSSGHITAPTISEQPVKSLTATELVCNIWVGVSCLLFMFFMLQYIIASKDFRSSSHIDFSSQVILAKLREELEIKNKLAVYKCSSIASPVIIGLINPRIYIPDSNIDSGMLEMMLRHELVHFKRKDILYKFIILLACCVHWFNPLVWLMNRQAQRDIEISCDEDVIRNKDKAFRRLYSDSIMSVIKLGTAKKLAFSTGFANDKETLIARFKKIYDHTIKKGGRSALRIVLAVCILCSGLVACTTSESDENFEIPQQAMDFIQFYCDYRTNDTFFERDGYDLGFAYLFEKNILKDEYIHDYHSDGSIGSYRLPIEAMMDVYQFLMADEMPAEWWNDVPELSAMSWASDYNYMNSPYSLTVKEVVKNDNNTFTATLGRIKDGIPEDDICFIMEQQTIDYIPEDLSAVFTAGDKIWRIKNVDILEGSWQPDPVTVFEINSIDDFLLFAEDYNKNGYMRVNFRYVLNTDIDFGGMELTPIGITKESQGFAAEFDGQGHTLSNFKITYEPQSVYSNIRYIGLFSYVSDNDLSDSGTAVIRNLNIENAEIKRTQNTRMTNVGAVGILAGYTTGALIENCHVSGTVDGHSIVGGLVGNAASSTISDCTADVEAGGNRQVGAFAGLSHYSYVTNCHATGTVTGYREDDPDTDPNVFSSPASIGGFTADIIGGVVSFCHSDVSLRIMSTARVVGAFSSSVQSADVSSCSYNPAKAGNWEIVDYYHEGYDNVDRALVINPSTAETGVYTPVTSKSN